jgi:hypothetical protein
MPIKYMDVAVYAMVAWAKPFKTLTKKYGV